MSVGADEIELVLKGIKDQQKFCYELLRNDYTQLSVSDVNKIFNILNDTENRLLELKKEVAFKKERKHPNDFLT